MIPNTVQNVVDSITEKEGKIVVTTTISLDKSALSSDSTQSAATLFGEVPNSVLSGMGTPMQRAISEGKIQVVKLGPKMFLGLVNGRTGSHALCIGDTLFIFVPRAQSLTGMAELVADLIRRLPPDMPWSGGRAASTSEVEGSGFDVESFARSLNAQSTSSSY